jgi:hypothetical protein
MKNLLLGAATSALAGFVVTSTGCMQERTYVDPTVDLGFGGLPASNMNLRDGYLRGDFGVRRGFDGEATNLQGSNDVDYRMTTVNIVREESARGAGMVILSTSGRTLDQLEPGEHAFRYDETGLGADEIFVNVCGGADASAFDYDAPATAGTLTIEDTPTGERRVDLHTETPVVDPSTGMPTGGIESSDSSFSYQPNR